MHQPSESVQLFERSSSVSLSAVSSGPAHGGEQRKGCPTAQADGHEASGSPSLLPFLATQERKSQPCNVERKCLCRTATHSGLGRFQQHRECATPTACRGAGHRLIPRFAQKAAQTCPTGVTRTLRVRSASPRQLPLRSEHSALLPPRPHIPVYASLSSTAAMGASAQALASTI